MMDMKPVMKSDETYCEECGDPVGDFECPIDAQLCRNCYEMFDAKSEMEDME